MMCVFTRFLRRLAPSLPPEYRAGSGASIVTGEGLS
jgi:hypothetical protein